MELMDLMGKVGSIVKETGKQVGDVVSEKTKGARDYAKDTIEISKLNNQIATCKDLMSKSYAALGEYYYEKYAENPEADIVETIRSIAKAKETIADLEARIDDIRSAQEELKEAKKTAAAEDADDVDADYCEASSDIDDELAKVKDDADSSDEE